MADDGDGILDEAIRRARLLAGADATGPAEIMGDLASRLDPGATQLSQLYDRAVTERLAQFRLEIGPAFQTLAQALEGLPERNRLALRVFARHGWYLDPGLPLPRLFELARDFERGDTQEADEALCVYFDRRCAHLQAEVVQLLPTRERLLQSAFAAHERQDYAASIPLFLTQADGICHDSTGEQLYRRRQGMPYLASLFREAPDSIMLAVLSPVLEATPLTDSNRDLASTASILNRHAILHGASTDYDSRVNSCRAMSLLVYSAWVFGRVSRRPDLLKPPAERSGNSGRRRGRRRRRNTDPQSKG